jgi:predicted PurR-regulated permease PerM
MVLRELQYIFIPLVIAYFLFFAFEPLNKLLRKYKIPSGITVLIDLILILGVIYGFSRVIFDQFSKFGAQLPIYEQKLNNIVRNTSFKLGIKDVFFTQFELDSILSRIDYGGLAGDFFTTTVSLFATVFFVIFFFIFISSGHNKVIDAFKNRFVEKNIKKIKKKIKKDSSQELFDNESGNDIEEFYHHKEEVVENTFRSITGQIQKYVSTKFYISIIAGVVIGSILWLFNIDFVIVWAVFAILFNYIPNLGSIVVVGLPSLMALIQYESFSYAFLILVVLIVAINIIGNYLEPKIFGDNLGLNPLVILFSLLLWGYIWGIVGMFLSVPLTAVIKIIISNSSSKNLKFITHLMDY